MKRWLLSLLVSLALCSGAVAENVGSAGEVRKLGPEESKALLKEVGIVIKDKPTYPDVAYRLYPKPYQVFELATVGYSPFEQEDGSPPNGMNPDDAKLWGPNGEPVVILRKPGDGMWVEGFFSKKRVEVDLDRYTYRYRKESIGREDRGETPDPNVEVLNRPKDYDSDWFRLFVLPRVVSSVSSEAAFAKYLSRFLSPSAKDNSILNLLKEIDTLPYPLGKDARRGGKLEGCEPVVWSIERMTVEDKTRKGNDEKLYWAKSIVRYYPTGQISPMGKTPWCLQRTPLVSWPDGGETVNHGDNSQPHLLPDGSILVKLGTDAVIRLRWEDGEPAGPLPPFIKVLDAREVIWAKLDLLRRYRDEMKRRGIKDATKLRTPTQIMHDLAAYFFDIQEIRNWKGDGK